MKTFVTILLLDKKNQQSRKVEPGQAGPGRLLVLNKNLVILMSRQAGRAGPGDGLEPGLSRVIKLIMPGVVSSARTTQALPLPGEMT